MDTEGEYDYDETVETLQRIFGIVGICPVVLVEDEGFDALAKVVCDYVDRTYPTKILHLRWMRAVPERIIR